MPDTFAITLYFFTIILILTIYTIERIFPRSNNRTRSGIDYITGKPYIQQDNEQRPEVSKKQINKIIADYEAVGIRFTESEIKHITTLSTISEICTYIDNNIVNK